MDLKTAWEVAGDTSIRDRVEAFNYLAAHRDELPGSVYVRLPGPDTYNQPEWYPILAESTTLCGCGLRRLILPTQTQAGYVLRNPHVYTIGNDQDHLAVGPWGGDYSSAFMLVMIQNGMLFWRKDPYAQGGTYATLPRPSGGISIAQVSQGGTTLCSTVDAVTLPVLRIINPNPDAGTVDVEVDETIIPITNETRGRHYACIQ